MSDDGHVVEKEMGYSRSEFMRLLPKAIAGADFHVEGDVIRVGAGSRGMRIELSAESERRLGYFRIPVLHVRLTVSGYGADERDAVLARFWLAYQKGGG